MTKSLKVPPAVRANAKKGLAMRKAAPKSKKGGLTAAQAAASNRSGASKNLGSGVQRAANLAQGTVSLETAKRMKGFFARHGDNIDKARANPSGHPKMRQADLLWGGAAGERWANAAVAKAERAKRKTKAP